MKIWAPLSPYVCVHVRDQAYVHVCALTCSNIYMHAQYVLVFLMMEKEEKKRYQNTLDKKLLRIFWRDRSFLLCAPEWFSDG